MAGGQPGRGLVLTMGTKARPQRPVLRVSSECGAESWFKEAVMSSHQEVRKMALASMWGTNLAKLMSWETAERINLVVSVIAE